MALPSRSTGEIDVIAERDLLAHGNIAGGKAGDDPTLNVGVWDIGIGHAGMVEA